MVITIILLNNIIIKLKKKISQHNEYKFQYGIFGINIIRVTFGISCVLLLPKSNYPKLEIAINQFKTKIER